MSTGHKAVKLYGPYDWKVSLKVGLLIPLVDKRVGGSYYCDPVFARAIGGLPERLGDEQLKIKRYPKVALCAPEDFSTYLSRSKLTLLTWATNGLVIICAGNALRQHNGMKFSTLDADKDRRESSACATTVMRGARWYNDCHACDLNSRYLQARTDLYGISWTTWHGH